MARLVPFSLLAVLFVVGLAPSASAHASAQTETARVASLESAVVQQINLVRVARGLRPLALSNGLTRAANTHSKAMLDGGFFAHESADGSSFSDRVKRFYSVKGAWSIGENLAMFGRVAPTARGVVQAWLDSPDHRDNLLEPSFREFGLGVQFAPSGTGVFGGMPVWVVTLDLGSRGTR